MSEHALSDIAQWIQDQAIGFTIGTNLYIGHIPLKNVDGSDIQDRMTVLLENAGGVTYGDLPDRNDQAVQFLSRAKKFTDAKADSYKIYNEFQGNEGLNLPIFNLASGSRYVAMTIDATSIPASVGQDDGGRWQFSLNMIFRLRDRI